MLTVLTVIWIVLSVKTATGGSWENESVGGDTPDMPILGAQSAEDCNRLCLENKLCRSWSYSSGCGTVSSCVLEYTVKKQSYNQCTVSIMYYDLSPKAKHCILKISGVKTTRLQPPVFRALPLGTVQPQGL